MIFVFPKAKRAAVAQGFGLDLDQNALATMTGKARLQTWWREEYVTKVADAIKQDLAKNHWSPMIQCDDAGKIELDYNEDDERVLKEPEPEVVASQYTPRRWRPARIIYVGAARPKTVTGALLGDPPQGRREMLASMHSPNYSAANESGRFDRKRDRGALEAAE